MIPKTIGRYEIKSELGRGGMAIVYLANDPRFDREVAVKVLPREFLFDEQFRVRFEREIKMVAQLEHPAIVPVHDVGEEDGQPYFVMRNMPGGSLSNWLKQGAFSLQDTARIMERVCKALAYAHKKGVVHRDLKPGNILFDSNGEAFISDFGVAKLAEAASTMTGSGVIGTPAYMSPEQAQSENVDARTDVYAIGAIVYEMLTGQQPYKADTPMGLILKHVTEPVPEILRENPNLPPEVDGIIKKAMDKDPNNRYATMIELAQALNKVAFGEEGHITDIHSTRPNVPTPVVPPSSVAPTVAPDIAAGSNKNWIWIGALAGMCFLAMLAGGGLLLLSGRHASGPTAEASQTPIAQPTFTPYPTYTPLPTNTVEAIAPTTEVSPTVPVEAPNFSPSQWSGTLLQPWGAKIAMNMIVEKVTGTSFSGKMSWKISACQALMVIKGEIIPDINAASEQNRWQQHPDFSGDKSGLWLKWTQTENRGNPNCYVNTGDWWYAHIRSNGHLYAIRFMNDTDARPANGGLDLDQD